MYIVNYFKSKLSADQQQKVIDVATKLGFEADWLCAVMYSESKFNPQAKNPKSGSIGLIQFTRDKAGVSYKTINGVKYELSSLENMNFVQQMDVVFEYFKNYKTSVKSYADLYLVTFFPLAVGKPDSFVFETKNLSASLIADQNQAIDLDKNKQITKAEFDKWVNSRYISTTNEPVKKKI